MNKVNKLKINPKELKLGLVFTATLMSAGLACAGTIAQAPLFIALNLDPNIMFILDDSGSMAWSYLPDSISGNRDRNRSKSSTYNYVYYNPTITYHPPTYADGSSLGNASFTNAWMDGYVSLPGHGGTTVNLSTKFRPTWNNSGDFGSSEQPAYYYKFSPPRTNCNNGAAGDINDDDCYVKVVVSTTSGPNGTDERQNFANWYSYYRTRLMMAKAGISRAFSQLGANPRVGYGRINKSDSVGIDGINVTTIERGVRAFNGADRTAFFTWLFARGTSGSTPLRRALDAAGTYYTNQTSQGPWSSTPGVSGGTLLPCRQSFTVLMTDGYWNGTEAGNSGARKNNDGTTDNNMTMTDANGVTVSYTPVGPFKDTYVNSLADVAMYYWKRDLCPNIANRVPADALDSAFWQHMALFGIGLGMPTTVNPNTAFSAIKSKTNISWPDPNTANPDSASPARIDDLLHASVNARGSFFNAQNPDEFSKSLTTALSRIVNSEGSSASAVATSSTRLDIGTQVFQALFNPKDWTGKLIAFNVSTEDASFTEDWEASTLMPEPALRNIWTMNPTVTSGAKGVQFQWANLSSTPAGLSQQDYLNTVSGVADGKGQLRAAWLRGDATNEQKNPGGVFRDRKTSLGDIVNSDPVYVGTQDYGYSRLPGDEGTRYAQYRSSSNYTTRRPMIYVGANDGMLHGFDANKRVRNGGVEKLAYIPNAVFPELSKLTSPTYIHQYYVDGASASSDVYDGTSWRTVLAGTTGGGGRAIFGLDVTSPDSFGPANVLWEFSNKNDTDMGYTMTQPSIVRLQDGHYAVIVGNGYNSENGKAVLFVLDALTGAVLQKIDTLAGSAALKNGLSSPLAVDTNNDLSVDTVYAGDLYGNLWKFNLSGSAGSWPVPTAPFFVACTTTGTVCSQNNRQPITGRPAIGPVNVDGTDQNGVGHMVYFGTGRYYESGDQIVGSSPQGQTFYGLWDKGAAITNRADLAEQNLIFEDVAQTACVNTETCNAITSKVIRVVSKNPVCYAATSTGCTASSALKKGWAFDLKKVNNQLIGERVVSYPIVRLGVVIFATMIPNGDACGSGGESFLMEVDALRGGEPEFAPFDADGNGVVDSNDYVMINGVKHAASGINLGIGIHKQPTIIEADDKGIKVISGSTSQTAGLPNAREKKKEDAPTPGQRKSWKQLK